MSIKHPSGGVESIIRALGLESKGEVWVRNIHSLHYFISLNLLPKSNESLPYLTGKKKKQSNLKVSGMPKNQTKSSS